jgi:hypothetical protein
MAFGLRSIRMRESLTGVGTDTTIPRIVHFFGIIIIRQAKLYRDYINLPSV